jgi:hypothetical protein
VSNRMVDQISKAGNSLCSHFQRSCRAEVQTWYNVFMTALADFGRIRHKNFPLNNFRTIDITPHTQAFGLVARRKVAFMFTELFNFAPPG